MVAELLVQRLGYKIVAKITLHVFPQLIDMSEIRLHKETVIRSGMHGILTSTVCVLMVMSMIFYSLLESGYKYP